eukprot:Blabericola_migrator_1__8640@NODE_452_length_8338_cov_76_789143_g354_i0_p1_GENE_NODE_452_length_8338_cov_76_789143_g354_i0NODE_452_length_8338_cov_76_789143_g354_i0_p1_ORF_typecomplete_len1120_score194_90_NODE_452_length_8338_cov_76_789143_g354_i041157474
MPSHNLTVAPISTVRAETVIMGLLCTLPTQGLSFTDNENVAAVCSQMTPSKKVTTKKPHCINHITALNEIVKKEPGTICVMKPTSKEVLFRVRELAIQSDPAIAKKIKLLEAKGMKYHIEIRRKSDSIKGREGNALGVWDATGIDKKSPLYTQALKNQANLATIETVNVDQAAAVKKLLTIVGNLTEIAPDSPTKNQAVQFKYFLDEVSRVVSDSRKTNAPKALLPGVVSAVFAKYKHKCWDGVMKLAGVEAATELQACADVLLDSQHINNYLKFVETAQLAPSGPSCEEFDVVFGLLSEVDTETTSLYRDIIVYLHDTVQPKVDSLDKLRDLKLNQGMKDEEIESQINQLNVCIRNYTQCFYNIAQDFVQIERMSVPDKKALLQASMYSRIAEVSRKFWPALEGCLERLCDSTVVEDLKSKDELLRKQLMAKSLLAGQLEQSVGVKDSSSESVWSRMTSYITNLLSSGKDGLKERDIDTKHDQGNMSPMFFDLLEIVEQLKTYGQIASSSPEESPDVPDTIAPGDHVAICGALGFVSKPKAAALFSYLKKLRKCLELIDYGAFAKEEELASIENFLNVDYHIMKTIQDEGHPLGVHGNMDIEECDQIMTSTFNRYFKESWPHISAVLEGGDQEESIKGLEGMANDISNWKDAGQELDPKSSQIFQILKKVANVNVTWYLAGMLTFLQGASSEEWKLHPLTQEIWTDGFCIHLRPGSNRLWGALVDGHKMMLCLPDVPDDLTSSTIHKVEPLADIAARQTFGSGLGFVHGQDRCRSSWERIRPGLIEEDLKLGPEVLHYKLDGTPFTDQLRKQSKILESAQKDGIDVNCGRAFKAQWYNAADQVIRELCERAYDKSVRSIHDNENQAWDHLLLDQYLFSLKTHYQGPNFQNSTVNSNYEGFVMCSDTNTLTDEEALNVFYNFGSYREDIKAQQLCTNKAWRRERRPIHVFHTSVKIDRDGQISIENRDHKGNIGSCVPFIQEEVQAFKSYRRNRHGSNMTESTKLMSGKEIGKLVNTFAEERGKGNYSNLTDQWIDTDSFNFADQWNDTESFNLTHTPSTANISTHVESNSIMTYLPYVIGVVGSIGTAFAGKRAWDRYKSKRYEGVATYTVLDRSEYE